MSAWAVGKTRAIRRWRPSISGTSARSWPQRGRTRPGGNGVGHGYRWRKRRRTLRRGAARADATCPPSVCRPPSPCWPRRWNALSATSRYGRAAKAGGSRRRCALFFSETPRRSTSAWAEHRIAHMREARRRRNAEEPRDGRRAVRDSPWISAPSRQSVDISGIQRSTAAKRKLRPRQKVQPALSAGVLLIRAVAFFLALASLFHVKQPFTLLGTQQLGGCRPPHPPSSYQ